MAHEANFQPGKGRGGLGEGALGRQQEQMTLRDTRDLVKELQYEIATLEYELRCTYADKEKRSKELEVMTEQYRKLEEDYVSVASYVVTRGGNLKDGESADQHSAQKCVKLEDNKALSADKEKIKLLEEAVKRLEGDNKKLEENVQKQGTELEIQRSLNTRFHGMLRKFAEKASESCKEIDGLVSRLREGGINTFEDNSTAPTPMEEIGGACGGDNSILDDMELPSTPASWSGWYSGSSSVISGGGRIHDELDRREEEEEDDMPPPAAFIDACNALTEEDWEELDKMAMEMELEREKEATAAKK